MMGILDYFRRKDKKLQDSGVKDVAPQRVIHIGGRPVLFQGETFQDSELDRKDVNIAVAVRAVSDSIAGLPIEIKRKILKDGEEVWENDTDHTLNELFAEPNRFNDGNQVIKHFCQSLIVTGNGYALIEFNVTDPTGLWLMTPWMIALERDANNIPSHYLLDPYRRKIRKEIEEVLHIFLYHFTNPFEGTFPNQPIKDQVQSNRMAVLWNKNFFINGAIPDVLFEDTFSTMPNPDQQEQFMESWDDRHKGVSKAHKRGILPAGVKPHILGQSIKDMMFTEMIKLNREQIYAFFRIPPSEAGVYQYANFANALIQKKSFWENTLIPFIDILESAFNRQLIYPFYGKDYKMVLNTSGVAALQEDKVQQATAVKIKYNDARLITLNEGRIELGYDPVEGGDEFAAQITPFGSEQGGDTDEDGKSSALPSKSTNVSSPRDNMRKKYEKRLTGIEKRFSNIIAGYFRDQRGRILDNIKKVTEGGLGMSLLYLQIKGDTPDDPSDIFDLSEENIVLEPLITPFMKDTIQTAGEEAIAEARYVFDFNVENPWVDAELNRIWNRSKLINEKSYETIKGLMRNAYEGNWSLGQLESAIKDQYTGWIKAEAGKQSRAMTIARTEMNAVVSGGSNQGYIQAGIPKIWLASIGEATRDSHIELDSRDPIAPEASWVTMYGNQLNYPGDPNGPPEEVVNCRCSITPYIQT